MQRVERVAKPARIDSNPTEREGHGHDHHESLCRGHLLRVGPADRAVFGNKDAGQPTRCARSDLSSVSLERELELGEADDPMRLRVVQAQLMKRAPVLSSNPDV